MALAIQQVTEDIILKLGKTSRELTNSSNLVLAGGQPSIMWQMTICSKKASSTIFDEKSITVVDSFG